MNRREGRNRRREVSNEATRHALMPSQGVVTYMSHVHVKAFVTGIKIESSDQSPFGGLIKGSR